MNFGRLRYVCAGDVGVEIVASDDAASFPPRTLSGGRFGTSSGAPSSSAINRLAGMVFSAFWSHSSSLAPVSLPSWYLSLIHI